MSTNKGYDLTSVQCELIGLLADGACHSGEEIGRYLGVSRAAIWKQLQKLSVFGLDVLSAKGQGYSLSQPIELLNDKLIFSSLSDSVKSLVQDLEVQFSVGSTNDEVLANVESIAEGKCLVSLAEFQYSGRGRRGRQWVSPLGCNLYISFLWQFDQGASVLEGLSLAVGVAVARALGGLGVKGLGLKWPNDVLLEQKKLGGVLLEMRGDPAGRCQVVVGIGINIAMPEGQPKIDQPWSAVHQVSPGCSRNQVAVALINQMLPLLASYANKGFAPYQNDWLSLDAYAGKLVSVVSGSQSVSGVASGVAENGALLLNVNGVERSFYGGELSLRLNQEFDDDSGS